MNDQTTVDVKFHRYIVKRYSQEPTGELDTHDTAYVEVIVDVLRNDKVGMLREHRTIAVLAGLDTQLPRVLARRGLDVPEDLKNEDKKEGGHTALFIRDHRPPNDDAKIVTDRDVELVRGAVAVLDEVSRKASLSDLLGSSKTNKGVFAYKGFTIHNSEIYLAWLNQRPYEAEIFLSGIQLSSLPDGAKQELLLHEMPSFSIVGSEGQAATPGGPETL